jgi:tRNA (guanine-N7-)-methyltransferase
MSTGLALRHGGIVTITGGALPLRSFSQRRGGGRGIFAHASGAGGGPGVSRGVFGGVNNPLASSLRRFTAREFGETRFMQDYKIAARAADDSEVFMMETAVSVVADGTPEGVQFKRYHGAKLMMEDSVFAELELAEACQKVAGVRVRQHVNPLKASLQVQAPVPPWADVFASTARPLVVDIGCGGGRFDLMMAKRYPEKNVLGVDIRAPLVERGNAWGSHAGLVDNLHFAECNATVSMGKWLTSYAEECDAAVEMVAIQFPDPHFKTRHHKRRVVQSALVRAVARGLTPGARVFLQSDVQEVSEDMRNKFERFGAHLFTLDADLHDVTAVDTTLLAARAAEAAAAAAAAFEADERARVGREAREAAGGQGRRGDERSAEQQQQEAAGAGAVAEGEGEGSEDIGEGYVEAESGGRGGGGWSSAWATAGAPGRGGWLDDNPLGVPTEREVQTTSTGGRCYRVMLVRNDTPV